MTSYLVPGFECLQGKLRFSGFSFSSTSVGSADVAPILLPDDVNVLDVGNGFAFSSFDPITGFTNFRAGDPDLSCLEPNPLCGVVAEQNTTISYNINGPMYATALGWGIEFNFDSIPDESGIIAETLCTKLGCFPTMDLDEGAVAGDAFPCDLPQLECPSVVFPVVTSARMSEQVFFHGGGGGVFGIDSLTNVYLSPPLHVPEPAAFPLVVVGLVFCGMIRYTMVKRQSRALTR